MMSGEHRVMLGTYHPSIFVPCKINYSFLLALGNKCTGKLAHPKEAGFLGEHSSSNIEGSLRTSETNWLVSLKGCGMGP